MSVPKKPLLKALFMSVVAVVGWVPKKPFCAAAAGSPVIVGCPK
jgi:hypothetical protein